MNSDPADVAASQLDFTGMHTGTNLNSKVDNAVANRRRTLHGPSRPIESGNEGITDSLDFSSATPSYVVPHQGMMHIYKIAPSTIAETRRVLGRINDVRKKHRRQNTIGFGDRSRSGKKFLNLINDRVLIADPWQMVFTG